MDRDATLRKAEKLLRQGKLDGAIQEYVRLVEEQPRDWNAINVLGDLYVRAGNVRRAVEQFIRIADHLHGEGFYPRAAALYKKALKAQGDHEHALLRLGELATRQGLVADAKLHLGQLARLRQARGDEHGANECRAALGVLPDAALKVAAGRAVQALGDTSRACDLFLDAAEIFEKEGRDAEALEALVGAAEADVTDIGLRARVAGRCLATGDVGRAREFLSREAAGDDPDLLLALARIELGDGRPHEARLVFSRLLVVAPHRSADVLDVADDLIRAGDSDAAFGCVDVVSETALVAGDLEGAIHALQSFLRHGAHIPALMRLVEAAVDAGRDDLMTDVQERLADAFLEADRGAEARVVAEDLVARDPRRGENVARLRRALVQEGTPEVDLIIARYAEPPVRLDGALPEPELREAEFELGEGDVPWSDDPLHVGTIQEVTPDEPETGSVLPLQSGIPDPGFPIPDPADRETPGAEVTEIDLSKTVSELGSGARRFVLPPAAPREAAVVPTDPAAFPPAPSAETPPAAQEAPPALEAVFERMRVRVRQDQGAVLAAQLDRGLEHLEHGRIADATVDLTAAARAPMLRFQAASALGRLFASQGELEAAVEWLERAAEAPAPSEGENVALLYELAGVLERMGESARALAILLEIDAGAPAYRDVPARIEKLTGARAGSRGA